jgi:hypothetical protein
LNIVLHFVGIWKQIKHNVYAGAVGGVIVTKAGLTVT